MPPPIEWRWCNLDDELAYLLDSAAEPMGWLATTHEDIGWTLIVYGAAFGKCARLEWGSLEMETDACCWEQGKETCEVMLRHAIALGAELNERAQRRLER